MDLLCNQILMKEQLSMSEMQMTQTMLLTNQSISALKNRVALSREKINEAVSDLVTKMEQKFMKLGLTEEQEKAMIQLVLDADQVIDLQVAEILSQEEQMKKILESSSNLRWQSSAK